MHLSEHFETVGPILEKVLKMPNPVITKDEIINKIKKLKMNKAPGPDAVKPDLFKYLEQCDVFLQSLIKLFNNILNIGTTPESWKSSNTVLIEKVKKPMVNQLRPIALTDTSYKIFMGILKDKVENHVNKSGKLDDLQTGATANRRVTENIFLVSYCIEHSFIKKKTLFILSIDYAKAFDSCNRNEILCTLQELHIHPKIIDIICGLFSRVFNERIKITISRWPPLL